MKKVVPDHKNTKTSLTTQGSDLVKKNKIEILVTLNITSSLVKSIDDDEKDALNELFALVLASTNKSQVSARDSKSGSEVPDPRHLMNLKSKKLAWVIILNLFPVNPFNRNLATNDEETHLTVVIKEKKVFMIMMIALMHKYWLAQNI